MDGLGWTSGALRVVAVDARTAPWADWNGEVTAVSVEIPTALVVLFASRQAGFFLDVTRPFGHGWFRGMPEAFLSAGARFEAIDLDRDLEGDSSVQLTAGVNLHPTRGSALKLDYLRNRARDRFNNAVEGAALKLSLTTYF
jgi:hypothetical protein